MLGDMGDGWVGRRSMLGLSLWLVCVGFECVGCACGL
jgi:hypothetical protein